jgi:hypothetical protein
MIVTSWLQKRDSTGPRSTDPGAARRLRRIISSLSLSLVMCCSATARAQDEVPLVGPLRDIARQVLLSPVAFDPTLVLPMTGTPQATIAAGSGGVTGSAHIGFDNGDDSYGISVTGPIANVDAMPTPTDPRGLHAHTAVGFDVTNVIWRPRATAALRNALGSDALATATPAQREVARRVMIDGNGIEAPWVVFFNVSYRFSRDEYDYADVPAGPNRTAHHLNDAATILLGAQLFARRGDPGLFVGLSYIYSAVFLDAASVAGVPIGAPAKLRADDVRLEVRRPLAKGRVGFAPAVTYDTDARLTTVDAAAYAFIRPTGVESEHMRVYAAVRAGHKQGSGAFASVVFGSLFVNR